MATPATRSGLAKFVKRPARVIAPRPHVSLGDVGSGGLLVRGNWMARQLGGKFFGSQADDFVNQHPPAVVLARTTTIAMPQNPLQIELTCTQCGAQQRCGPTQMLQHLADLGMLKRAADPDLELLHELLRSAVDRLNCQVCQAVGLTLAAADDDPWDEVRHCEGCRKPIPPERLEVFPDTTRCARCQSSAEDGSDQVREFCDSCGSVMSLQLRRSAGSAAYELKCPSCGR